MVLNLDNLVNNSNRSKYMSKYMDLISCELCHSTFNLILTKSIFNLQAL